MHKFSLNFLPSASIAGDKFMNFINVAIIVGVLMFVVTIGAAIYWSLKYKSKNDTDEGAYIPGNYLMEFTGVFLISIWVAVFFLWGWRDYSYIISPKMDEYEVNVIGQQWLWQVQYASGKTLTNEVYLPRGRPVHFVMTSKDVLHSFFLPEMRVKQDVVPGQFTSLHVTPTKSGSFNIFCAEYCGTAHSKMLGVVHVLEPEDFQKWLDGVYVAPAQHAVDAGPIEPSGAPKLSMAERGSQLFQSKACVSCHSVKGERLIGPTVKGLFGSEVELMGGAKVTVDENYLRESIMDPMKKVVKGYAPQMPTFRGMLSDEDVNDLIAYVKTLK
ncbi:MAG TPA: cytochrome c oxidase subunit II [Bdellovibrionota bacterium]|jgi:cytochrome c oxidase subunit 2